MTEETLNDVTLKGRVLVSDDPSDWKIPESMLRHDSVLDWWDHLRASDDAWNRTDMPLRQRKLLLWMTQLFAELDSINPQTIVELSKIRTVVRGILAEGLTIEQTAILLGRTDRQIVRFIYGHPSMTDQQIDARLWLEKVIHTGVSDYAAADATGLTRSEVSTFRKAIGLDPNYERVVPPEVRDQAIELRSRGVMPAQIAEILASQGHNVSRLTISQWWTRHNKQQQRKEKVA